MLHLINAKYLFGECSDLISDTHLNYNVTADKYFDLITKLMKVPMILAEFLRNPFYIRNLAASSFRDISLSSKVLVELWLILLPPPHGCKYLG